MHERNMETILVAYIHNMSIKLIIFLYFLFKRWAWNVLEFDQQHGARYHVFLLHGGGDGTALSEISLVEKTLDDYSTSKQINK